MDSSIRKLDRWMEEKSCQKVVEEVEALPAGKRGYDRVILWAIARCRMDGSEEEIFRRVDWRAPQREEQGPEEENLTAQQCFCTGCMLCALQREGEAMEWFRQAEQRDPELPDLPTMKKGCIARLSRTVFPETFARRAVRIWERFVQEEGEIRALLQESEENTAAAEEVRNHMAGIFGEMLCASGMMMALEGDQVHLIFHPVMGEPAIWPLHYMTRVAPDSLKEKWIIQVGSPRQDRSEVTIGDRTLPLEEIQVRVQAGRSGQNRVQLSFYSEALIPLLQTYPTQVTAAMGDLLVDLLGEMTVLAVVEKFRVSQEPLSGGAVPVTRLARKLELMGCKLNWSSGEYLYDRIVTLRDMPPPEKGLRRDGISLVSRWPRLHLEYLNMVSNTADMWRQDGIGCGFLYWSSTSDSVEENRRFLDEVQGQLYTRAGNDVLTVVGTLIGRDCCYLDLIAWDMSRMMDTAKAWAATSGLKWVAFHTFHWDAEPVTLWRRPRKTSRKKK